MLGDEAGKTITPCELAEFEEFVEFVELMKQDAVEKTKASKFADKTSMQRLCKQCVGYRNQEGFIYLVSISVYRCCLVPLITWYQE